MNAAWLSVPEIGDWEQKGHVLDYSMDFTQIIEIRKCHKSDASQASIITQEEFITATMRLMLSPKQIHTTNNRSAMKLMTLKQYVYSLTLIFLFSFGYMFTSFRNIGYIGNRLITASF